MEQYTAWLIGNTLFSEFQMVTVIAYYYDSTVKLKLTIYENINEKWGFTAEIPFAFGCAFNHILFVGLVEYLLKWLKI